MRNQKRMARTLCLTLLAALGLIALTASAAYAGEFRVAGKTFTEAGIEEETATGTGGSITLTSSGGVKLTCSTVDYGKVTWLKKGDIHANNVKTLGCSIAGNEACEVFPTEKDAENKTNAKTLTVTADGRLVLSGTSHYIELVGLGAEKLVMKVYLVGASCSLPKESKVTGSTAFELPSALTEWSQQPMKMTKPETAKLLGVQLFFNKETATLSANEASLELSGANAGKTWGAE